MNRKTTKQIGVLRERLAKLQEQLSATRKQCDDPEELAVLDHKIAAAQSELSQLLNTEKPT